MFSSEYDPQSGSSAEIILTAKERQEILDLEAAADAVLEAAAEDARVKPHPEKLPKKIGKAFVSPFRPVTAFENIFIEERINKERYFSSKTAAFFGIPNDSDEEYQFLYKWCFGW